MPQIPRRPAPLARLLEAGSPSALSDARLVERFVATRDPEAFAAIVARHGPTVMAACRSRPGAADPDDAFQATFLVLLGRIGTFPVGDSLGGWLYRVARRLARQSRQSHARRRRRERAACPPGRAPGPDLSPERSELRDLIRREVDGLPERYRAPIVLCDLEGLTRERAAEALGCPAGTVAGRLARARRRLRERLERRGIDSPTALSAPLVGKAALESASRSAAALGAGGRPTPAVAALAARAAGPWAGLVPIKAAVALAAAAFFAGGLLAAGGPDDPPPGRDPAPPPPALARPNPPEAPDPEGPATAGRYAGRVVDREGRPIAGARVFVNRSRPRRPAVEVGPLRARSDGDGRFAFEAPDMTFRDLDGLPSRRRGLMVAAADGYAPDWLATWGETRGALHGHADPIKGAALTLRLVPDVPILGRIVDPEGRPIAGASVRTLALGIPDGLDLDGHLERSRSPFGVCHIKTISPPDELPGVSASASTDDDGRFRLSGLGADRIVDLVVSAPGRAELRLQAMTREVPDVVFDRDADGRPRRSIRGAAFTASLDPDHTVAVTGMVRDADTGRPIAGMRVGRDWGQAGRPEEGFVVTDAEGRFAVPGFHPDEIGPPPPPSDPMTAAPSRRGARLVAVPDPGRPHLPAGVLVDRAAGLVVECRRGVAYRLTLRDEAGAPVEARVESWPVSPSPFLDAMVQGGLGLGLSPIGQATETAPGVYEGVLPPGPGAVLARSDDVGRLRPPYVDPKAFFAPGRTDWTPQDLYTAYGGRETLMIGGTWARQEDFAAIVLTNPRADAPLLELAATVVRDRPRDVTLLDPEGRPLLGVVPDGLTSDPGDQEPRLRAATVAITRLHPDRGRRMTFVHEGRRLIGSFLARGDGDAPYTVTLRPWATLTGRIVGPAPAAGSTLGPEARRALAGADDSGFGPFPTVALDADGRFRAERLVPGLRHSAEVYRNLRHVGAAFEGLVLEPGEVRDLGDLAVGDPARSGGG